MRRKFHISDQFRDADGRRAKPAVHESATFEEAVVVHLDSVFAFAMRLAGGRRDIAQDLVQETCLRAFKNFETLRSPESAKSWLFQILANVNKNQIQQQLRRLPIADVELTEDLLQSVDAEGPITPEHELFDRRLDHEIREALEALPVEFRAVVWLSDVEGLNYREISEIVGCPMGTVASRLYRGHRMLRENLLEYGRRRGLAAE
jgi:RNA polymerase sigma-70 factor (ECF subfamily)